MEIQRLFSILVPPGKNKPDVKIFGTEIPLSGELFDLINNIYQNAPNKCNIPICFTSENQRNSCRDEIINCIKTAEINQIKDFFNGLSKVTTAVPGIALCFFVIGSVEHKTNLMISRFPATEAIRTNLSEADFRVDVVKDIYLRSSKYYKSVYYESDSIDNGFWKGIAIDKQTNSKDREISGYWIKDFLQSELEITSKSGTAEFARALKETVKNETAIESTEQIIAFSKMLQNHHQREISIQEQCNNFGLDEGLIESIKGNLINSTFFTARFIFNKEEFHNQALFRTVYMENGAILSAAAEEFENCFVKEKPDDSKDEITYSTTGLIQSIKIRNRV